MRCKRDQMTAVVIDMQERLLPAMYEKENLLQNSVKLLQGLKLLEVPVLMTQQYTKGLGATVPEICAAVGTSAYLEKLRFSAYEVLRPLIGAPEETNIVLLCGIEAHICVLQTALELKERGYQPVLAVDCISSRKKSDLEIALRRAEQEGILLTSCESVLFELTETAGTETFKAVQRLIKQTA